MHPAVAPLALIVLGVTAPCIAPAATTFRVTVPGSTPAADHVYIAGSFQGWNPGHPAYVLTRQPDQRWTITLDLPSGTPIQFKFTRGSWAQVEKGPSGEEIANRSLMPAGDQTFDFTVATWADLGTITGRVETFSTPAFLGGRRCWVYLPPGYAGSTDRYPVLYMHDGQNLFDVRTSFSGEWRVDEACEALIGSGEIAPLIVVGIENGPARCTEYTPWVDPGVTCGGGGGDAYLTAIRDVLIPAIDANYRTLSGPENRWMSGSSLGGLITAYAAYAFDVTWGRVAAVSPSYWWANRMMLTYAAPRPKPAVQKFYQDMGTAESGVANLRDMRDILLAQGFVTGVDLASIEAAGHAHNEASWALRVPDLLRFLAHRGTAGTGTPDAPRPGLALRVSPNPVVANARFDMSLERAAVTRVVVVDVHGRQVRTVHDGPLAAGRHTFVWDGRDREGRAAKPGLYWVRGTGDGASGTRAFVVLQ